MLNYQRVIQPYIFESILFFDAKNMFLMPWIVRIWNPSCWSKTALSLQIADTWDLWSGSLKNRPSSIQYFLSSKGNRQWQKKITGSDGYPKSHFGPMKPVSWIYTVPTCALSKIYRKSVSSPQLFLPSCKPNDIGPCSTAKNLRFISLVSIFISGICQRCI